MTKTTQSLRTTPGDLLKVKCKVHGTQVFIAGIDFPSGTPAPKLKCPHCREVAVGKAKVGTFQMDGVKASAL